VTERSNVLPAAFGSTAFRLAATTVALFLVAAAAIAAVLVWQTNRVLTDQVLATLQSEAEGFQLLTGPGRLGELRNTVAARSRPEGPGLYFLADKSGQKLAGNLSRDPPELADGEQGGIFRYQTSINGRALERTGVAIPLQTADGARLVVGRDIEEPRAFANRVKLIFLLSFGIVSLLGLGVGLAISRLVLKRIDAINQTGQSIMEGDLTRRVPVTGSGDEIDGLATNLNAMLDRIEKLMNGMREVSDNIAHDLKTPLNRLRNAAEAALRDPRGGEGYREGLERTIERADELIKTFNALLLVARLEAGAVEENSESFDLGVLVQDVTELYEPAAEEAGFEIVAECGAGPQLSANRQLIGQALANLIDNAIKYSARTDAPLNAARVASIEVGVTTQGDRAEISVSDHGPGISEQDRERALKRFVRLEESRTRPGTGLGLSLVAAVARLHRGGIRLEDNSPGLRVVLWLPRRVISGQGGGARQAAKASQT
jgi:signal transduction histidine kinase